MASRNSRRLRALAAVLRGERAVTDATRRALAALLAEAARALAAAGYDTSVLDSRWPMWRTTVDTEVVPAIEAVFLSAFTDAARGVIDPEVYATRHLEAVHNRLVGVADGVFDTMRLTLEEGRLAQEGIPQLAARVDALLTDEQRWTGRARTIARTEVISANNAGALASARATAEVLGVDAGDVVRVWLSTLDSRTRESHAEMDGEFVVGLDATYDLAGGSLSAPGDPYGPAEEVINCRCTELFYYPGDPEYVTYAEDPTLTPETLAAAGTEQEDPVTSTPPETDPDTPEDAPLDAPTHAGVAVQAADTARVLMLQRTLDPEDPPEVRGTWEFPGGSLEDGETPEAGAWREWQEETGLPVPEGETTGGWRSPDGVYQGFVFTVPVEADAFSEINPDLAAAEAVNPDDPERRTPDVTAWWTLEQIEGMGPGLRPEVRDTDWTQFQPAPQEDDMPENTPDAVAAAAGDPAPVPVDADPIEPGLQIEGEDLGDQFYGVAVVENSETGDGRVFAPGAIAWDTVPLPVPLGWQVSDAPGHDGAVVCGRVDSYVRLSNGRIGYTGTWDLDGAGWETRRLAEGRFLNNVSVDTDDFDAIVVDRDGNPVDPMMGMFGDEQDVVLLVNGARLRGHTICRVQALTEAWIANGTPPEGWDGERPWDSPQPVDEPVEEVPGDTPVEDPAEPMPSEDEAQAVIVAAAVAAGNPPATLPPAEAFSNPGLTAPTPVTVTEDGRVYGHLATWGTCHIGLDGCVTPPSSRAAYAYFLTGEVETTAGWVPVGQITMGTGHAGVSMGARPAAAHYDNTGFAVADVFCGEDEHGIWVAGLLRDGLDAATVASLRAAGALSGDWRKIAGNLELVAALAVNVPGFPVPRLSVAASAGEPYAVVAAGMVPATPEADREALAAGAGSLLTMTEVYAAIDRRERRRQVAARLDSRRADARRARMAAARGRISERV